MIITTTKTLRPRAKNDLYPTPIEFCRAAVNFLPSHPYPFILDPGAGWGTWGQAARERFPNSFIQGIEIDRNIKVNSNEMPYNVYTHGDFLEYPVSSTRFDYVIGNPPYKFAIEFIEHSLAWLNDGGYLLFLLRLAFLESQERYVWWLNHRPGHVWVLSRRPSFTGDRKTDATAYALYIWRKGHNPPTNLSWIYWDYE